MRVSAGPLIPKGWFHIECFGKIIGSKKLAAWKDDDDDKEFENLTSDVQENIDKYHKDVIDLLKRYPIMLSPSGRWGSPNNGMNHKADLRRTKEMYDTIPERTAERKIAVAEFLKEKLSEGE